MDDANKSFFSFFAACFGGDFIIGKKFFNGKNEDTDFWAFFFFSLNFFCGFVALSVAFVRVGEVVSDW